MSPRTLIVTATITVIASAVLGASAGEASADAGTHPSCIGFEASAISPAGSSDEFPGGMPQLTAYVRSLGGPQGALFSLVARLHEGSHEACDEATE